MVVINPSHSGPDWWSFLSTVLGAIVGASASGTIAYALARQAAKNTAELAAADRLATQKAIGLRMIVKLKQLADNAYSIHKTIETGIAEAEKAGVTGPLVFRMPPIAGSFDLDIKFEPDELGLLIGAKEDALMNDLSLIAARQKTINAGIKDYNARKFDLMTRFPPPEMEGQVGQHYLSAEQRKALLPFVVDVDTLATGLRELAQQNLGACVSTSNSIGPALQTFFNDPSFVNLTVRLDLKDKVADGADDAKEAA